MSQETQPSVYTSTSMLPFPIAVIYTTLFHKQALGFFSGKKKKVFCKVMAMIGVAILGDASLLPELSEEQKANYMFA